MFIHARSVPSDFFGFWTLKGEREFRACTWLIGSRSGLTLLLLSRHSVETYLKMS